MAFLKNLQIKDQIYDIAAKYDNNGNQIDTTYVTWEKVGEIGGTPDLSAYAKITDLDPLKSGISTNASDIKKLKDALWPLKVNCSISPTALQEIGNTVNVTISNFTATVNNVNQTITSKTVNGAVISDLSFTDTITNSKSYNIVIATADSSASVSKSVTFVYPMFAGFNAATTMTTTVISNLTKQALRTGLNFDVTAVNTSATNYFWFVTPYTVTSVIQAGFDIFSDFEYTTFTYLNHTYNCYRLKSASAASTFKFTIK